MEAELDAMVLTYGAAYMQGSDAERSFEINMLLIRSLWCVQTSLQVQIRAGLLMDLSVHVNFTVVILCSHPHSSDLLWFIITQVERVRINLPLC